MLAGIGVASSFAGAQVITVTTLEDIYDTGTAVTVDDLPGFDGQVSMREAVLAANNTAGPQTIAFAIPESEFWTGDGVGLLKLDGALWYVTGDETTIDFTTQTTNIADSNPTGPEIGVYGFEPNGWGHPAIIIAADNCVIKGMGRVAQRTPSVEIQGNNNLVIGCETLGIEIGAAWQDPIAMNNIIGGTTIEERNDLGFIDILSWADDNIVIGNQIKSIRIAGTDFTHFPSRNRIGGSTPEERNVISGFGYIGEEGFPVGEGILLNRAQDTLIEGNYIGTTADGMNRVIQRGPNGIEVRDSINTTIKNNLISGIYVLGVNHAAGRIFGTAIHVNAVNADNMGVTIQGNLIGTDAAGENGILTYRGISVAQSTGIYTLRDTLIGGTESGEGNTVAFTETTGVLIGPLTTGARISGNSIHDNMLLGIDLLPWSGVSGPTPNDAQDADTNGGNAFQNYPEITGTEIVGNTLSVNGILESTPNSVYSIEIFVSPECDPSGFGEGQVFLGSAEVNTDASGSTLFEAVFETVTPIGWVVSATATELVSGNTSEFSPCESVVGSACIADMNNDDLLNFFDVSAFLSAFSMQNPLADFNNDGQFNFFDVSAFLSAFAAGCP